ncbi:hypothetical protein AGMMS50262_15940 [Bacteroidia bacterium]|nr:hypothetical protein AGMMS50262_15940 [Bacteroidia bacterium]
MKKMVILLMLFASCLFSSAQQALWSTQEVVSPEIHADNTVTFRLSAPNAVKVEITGDFLDAPNVAELTKNEQGVWEYTTAKPLASELYSYSLVIDGVKIIDPANIYMIRDVSSVSSVFIIGGGQGDLYKVNDVPHGTLTRTWYDSSISRTGRIGTRPVRAQIMERNPYGW